MMHDLRSVALLCGGLAVATLTACAADDDLGGDDGTTHGTSAGDDGIDDDASASMSVSSSSPVTDATDDGSVDGTTAADTMDDPTGTPDETCLDWAAPPFDCEIPGAATARVTGDHLPMLDDEPCTIASVQNVAPDRDEVTLDCGRSYVIEIATEAPHLDLPFAGGEDVLVTAREARQVIDETVASFVIRSINGDLLLAWVNVLGHDIAIDVDLDPLEITVAGSGCPTSFWNELCEGAGAIALQRHMLEIGGPERPFRLFDHNQAIAPAGAADVSLIAEQVEAIVCWDDACAGDDTGPFDRITFIAVVLPFG